MSSCYEKIFHDDPNCSSPNKSLQVFVNDNDTFTGTCFSCGSFVKDPYGDNPPDPTKVVKKSQAEIAEDIQEIRACGSLHYNHRAIPIEDWDFYHVKLLYNEYDGKTPYAIAHPFTCNKKLSGYKVKLLNKKVMWSVGNTQGADLYGWEIAKKIGGKYLYITEGEEDAIALRHILREMNSAQYKNNDYAVVSLPRGVKDARKCIAKHLKEIEAIWENVVLVFDGDEQGKAAAKDVKRILPKCMSATLPYKDANKCLQEGKLKATRDAVIFRASAELDVQAIQISSIIEEALEPVKWGLSYPWKWLTDQFYGQRLGEVISIGGGTGSGKTLTAHELAAHNALEHGWNSLGMFLEETKIESVQNIAGKVDSITYHVPDTDFDRDQFRATAMRLSDNIELWDSEESVDPETDWTSMKQMIKSKAHYLDNVFIDNLTTLTEGMSATERNDFIGSLAKDCVDMGKKFKITFFLYSHLNAPDKNSRPHESGGVVKPNQFTGSRALQRYSHAMLGFERNQQANDPNCSLIRIVKARKFGKTGFVKTYYDPYTGRLFQKEWENEMYEDKKI
ncbi:MAG: toprim domain-containing protein [Ekhidna sp.]|nr:toprim domain-containing protein [Ekhidna sp.]